MVVVGEGKPVQIEAGRPKAVGEGAATEKAEEAGVRLHIRVTV